MTEQKQYTREQLMSKKTFWKRFSSGSLFAGVGLAVGSLFLTIPYLTPKKPEEFTQYVNAQQTYSYLQRQREEVGAPNLPYENEAIQKFLDFNVDKTKAKALEDAIESASAEMSANFKAYDKYNLNLNNARDYVSTIPLVLFLLGGAGWLYGGNNFLKYGGGQR